ncbi:TolC family protein [Comamonas thiooxydans]|uniref:TolC family protein n=1 Tax=Comamonas thiooxydans TaxID=363952 RepID=UPI002113A394|nr:TolC family protein [Comamonas thiooxydans]UUE95138.1 TolC family protein [Comamonas thiooxydans]
MFPTFVRAASLAAVLLPVIATAETISFDQALILAVQRSEAARAAQATVQSSTHYVRAASQLPDPMLRAGIDNLPVTGSDRWSSTRESMTMKRIGISQEWISADKRAARENAARAKADREVAQKSVVEADARLQAALAYVDAWFAGEALKLTTQTEHHLHEELEASKSRLAAATGNSTEALQLLSAKGIAEDESEEVRQQQAAAMIGLQRWIGILPDDLIKPPNFITPTQQDYVVRYPTVTGLQSEVEVARQNATVTGKERSANWTWEVSYGQRTGYSDLVSVGVSIPLQIAPSQRQDRETSAKLAMVDKAEADLAEGMRAATADYRTLAGDAARLQQRIERYQGSVVVPARQRTSAALAAYRSNQSPLTVLFEARHAEVEAQRKLLALQRDLSRAQAQLAFKPIVQGGAQ